MAPGVCLPHDPCARRTHSETTRTPFYRVVWRPEELLLPASFYLSPRVRSVHGCLLVQRRLDARLHSSHSWAMLLAPAGHPVASDRAINPRPDLTRGLCLAGTSLHSSHSKCRRGVSRDGKSRRLAGLCNTSEFGRRLRASCAWCGGIADEERSLLTPPLQVSSHRVCLVFASSAACWSFVSR